MMELLENHLLINSLIAWAAAQIIKTIIYASVNRTLDFHRLVGDGGMPSGHSATVTALAVTAGLEYGVDSAIFAVATILAVIVMHDAMGIRLEAGRHAKALNELLELFSSDIKSDEKMKEILGHTPLQVAFGALLGLAVALLLG
ncbi:divergent PAP2 family protein [Oscillibacter ruminantium]|jgi:acid phosphatase family membrane protein YuiD|uniref:divergent PAP2 family protein n=1 Tax=Oscillibacter ruminantium TaxID=1263547 RepID=UPI0002E73AD1